MQIQIQFKFWLNKSMDGGLRPQDGRHWWLHRAMVVPLKECIKPIELWLIQHYFSNSYEFCVSTPQTKSKNDA